MFNHLTGITIGPLIFHYYGMVIASAVAAGLLMSYLRTRKIKAAGNHLLQLSFWMILSGIVGARIWHLLTPPVSMVQAGFTTRFYLTHPLDALSIWNGGLGLPGAILGIGICLFLYCRRHQLRFFHWADILTPSLLLVHSIGVWGNFITQSSYGKPTSLPWAIEISMEHRLPGFEQAAEYHPLFFYTSLLTLALLAALFIVEAKIKRKLPDGAVSLAIWAGFGIIHFLLEFIRLDGYYWGSLPANQIFMGMLAGFVLTAFLFVIKRAKNPGHHPD